MGVFLGFAWTIPLNYSFLACQLALWCCCRQSLLPNEMEECVLACAFVEIQRPLVASVPRYCSFRCNVFQTRKSGATFTRFIFLNARRKAVKGSFNRMKKEWFMGILGMLSRNKPFVPTVTHTSTIVGFLELSLVTPPKFSQWNESEAEHDRVSWKPLDSWGTDVRAPCLWINTRGCFLRSFNLKDLLSMMFRGTDRTKRILMLNGVHHITICYSSMHVFPFVCRSLNRGQSSYTLHVRYHQR